MRARLAVVVAVALTAGSLTGLPAEAVQRATVTFTNGRLVVTGTPRPEKLVVSRVGRTVRVMDGRRDLTPTPAPRVRQTRLIVVRARGGDDRIVVDDSAGRLPPARIDGGTGSDVLRGSSADDVIAGGAGNDRLVQSAGSDTLAGGTGEDDYRLDADVADVDVRLVEPLVDGFGDTVDLSRTSTVDLTVDLGLATQQLTAAYRLVLGDPAGFEEVVGGSLDDTLRGGPGHNLVWGGPGDDVLGNSQGSDFLNGGAGDSFYAIDGDLVGSVSISEDGGPETDVVSLIPTTGSGAHLDTSTTSEQQVTPTLTAEVGHWGAIDRIYGSAQPDTLIGNVLPNWIDGGGGDDDISGGGGGDSLFASDGEDTVRGGAGDDLYVLDGDATAVAHLVETTGGGSDILFFGDTQLSGVDVGLSDTGVQAVTAGLDVQLSADDTFEDVTGSVQDDTIAGNGLANAFRGRSGQDTFVFGEAVGGGGPVTFGSDSIADFGATDTIDLATGLSVRSGLGTASVTVWDGGTDFGLIGSSSGHLWTVGDFT